MPEIIPFIPLIAAGIGAGTAVYGSDVASKDTQEQINATEQAANTEAAAQQQATQAQQQQAQQQASTAATQAVQPTAATQSSGNSILSNINSSTSGFVNPNYLLSVLQGAGLSNPQAQEAANAYFGLSAPTSTSLTSSTSGSAANPSVVNGGITDLYTGMGLT